MPSHVQMEVGRGGAGPRGVNPTGQQGWSGVRTHLRGQSGSFQTKARHGPAQDSVPTKLKSTPVWDEFATKPKMAHVCFTLRKMRFESKP